MRRALALLVLAALAGALAGCGGRFSLPTENTVRVIPGDGSYQMVATWTGMDGIRDILLTPGSGTQLFLLFNHGGVGTAPRGEVLSYARLKATGDQTPIAGIAFATLFNPVALCAGGDGAGAEVNRVFVLDQGDSTLARVNPLTGIYGDTTGIATGLVGKWRLGDVSDFTMTWRVREYGLVGGDTISTFTDTTIAFVHGVASDAQGRVYVAGPAIVWVQDEVTRAYTRAFFWRVSRYARGLRYPGVYDYKMPGVTRWHLDSTWVVREGSGVGRVQDPRGIFWGAYGGGAVYTADYGKNWVQKLSDAVSNTGYFALDMGDNLSLLGPEDVTADPQGFIFVADVGNQRVLRYDAGGAYVQKVNIENDAFGRQLLSPITVAADDSLVFVGDAAASTVIRYKRRQ
jgi:hypothetical protein